MIEKYSIILLVLCGIFQPQNAVVVDEITLEKILNQQCVADSTAKSLSAMKVFEIGDLYGEHRPTVENFNPGPEFLEYFHGLDEYDLPEIRFSEPFQSPKRSVLTIFDYIQSALERSAENKLVVISGRPQTGKTTTLQLVGKHLQQLHPLDSIVYVDLTTLSAANIDHITLDHILQHSMKKEFIGLFKNIAEINPSGTAILLDGIDQVPHAQNKILSLIKDLHSKNTKIVMTGNPNIVQDLLPFEIRPREIKIPSSMSSKNLNNYLANNLIPEIHRHQPFWEEQSFVIDYLETVKIAIQETPLPRVIGTIEELAQEIKTDASFKLDDFILNAEDPTIPRKALKNSDYMKFNKYKFYDDFFHRLNPVKDFYGPQALNDIFKSGPELVKNEIQGRVRSSNDLLSVHGEESFKFINFKNGMPDTFSHREYQRYFASKYILDSLATESPLVESFKVVMHESRYKFLLEFINSAMHDSQYSQHIGNRLKVLATSNTEFLHTVMDNLIKLKMDNLCSEMFKSMGENQIHAYLEQSPILKSENKYNFGMLADLNLPPDADYIPRKTPWQYTGSRAEMIINLEMKESSQALKSLGFLEDPSVSLDYVSKKGITELNSLLDQFPEHKFSVESLNKAMFESMNSLGEQSIEVLNKLWELGARPHDFQVEGRTLAHIAAEKSSKTLLQTVHERYGVPLDSHFVPEKFGQSLLATALDSNPFPSQTRHGFWPMMEYLIQNVDISQYVDSLKKFSPTIPHASDIPEVFETKMSQLNFEAHDPIDLFNRFVHLEDVGVSAETLAVRRNMVIKSSINAVNSKTAAEKIILLRSKQSDHVTISEIIIQHRGRDTLQPVDEAAYKNTIKNLLQQEGKTFNKFQMDRVYKSILKNAASRNELHRINQWITQDVFSTFDQGVSLEHTTEFSNLFHLRDNNRLPRIPVMVDLQHQILATMYDWEEHLDNEAEVRRVDNSHDDLGYESPGANFPCEL